MARLAQAAAEAASAESSAVDTGGTLPRASDAASTGPHRHPSGHTFDETESRCLTCGWEFREVQVATGGGNSLPSYQVKQAAGEDWRPVWQDGTLPARWPRCPNPAPDETVEDLES